LNFLKFKNHIYLLILIILFLVGCAQKENKNKIVLWTGMNTDKELEMLHNMGKEFENTTGIKVDIIPIPFSDLQNKFQIAAPAKQGPDLITGPQDWAGIFAAAKLISPLEEYVPEEEQKKFVSVSIEGASYENTLYAIPLSFECVALIYNKDFVSKPPSTMEELIKEAKNLTITTGEGDKKKYERYGFLVTPNDFFVVFPIFSGRGTCVFNNISDPTSLGLNNDGAKEAARIIYNMRDFTEDGFIPEGITGDRVLGTFMEGKTAMIINGPWAINELDKVGRNYGISPLPPFEDENIPKPFVGILGIMLNRFAKNPEAAVKFMLFMNNKENQVKIYKALNRIPARIEALQAPEVQADEKIMGFYHSAENGIPLPNMPVMSSVWDPMVQSLTLITTEKRDDPDKFIEEQLNTAVKRIQNNIKRLLR